MKITEEMKKSCLEAMDNKYETSQEWVQVQAVIGLENYNTIIELLQPSPQPDTFIVNDNGDYEWVARKETPDIDVSLKEICELLNASVVQPDTVTISREKWQELADFHFNDIDLPEKTQIYLTGISALAVGFMQETNADTFTASAKLPHKASGNRYKAEFKLSLLAQAEGKV